MFDGFLFLIWIASTRFGNPPDVSLDDGKCTVRPNVNTFDSLRVARVPTGLPLGTSSQHTVQAQWPRRARSSQSACPRRGRTLRTVGHRRRVPVACSESRRSAGGRLPPPTRPEWTARAIARWYEPTMVADGPLSLKVPAGYVAVSLPCGPASSLPGEGGTGPPPGAAAHRGSPGP